MRQYMINEVFGCFGIGEFCHGKFPVFGVYGERGFRWHVGIYMIYDVSRVFSSRFVLYYITRVYAIGYCGKKVMDLPPPMGWGYGVYRDYFQTTSL